jgi:hypothetical protein
MAILLCFNLVRYGVMLPPYNRMILNIFAKNARASLCSLRGAVGLLQCLTSQLRCKVFESTGTNFLWLD